MSITGSAEVSMAPTAFSILQTRRGPPLLLGNDASLFPYSASTPLSTSHPSGLQLRIVLSTRHPDALFRSGEVIEGTVFVSCPPSSADGGPIKIYSLTLEAYFESRTLFWGSAPKTDLEKAKPKFIPSTIAVDSSSHKLVVAHEVHRGLVPREDLELSWEDGKSFLLYVDEVGEDGITPEVSLPFTFRVPDRMHVTDANWCPGAPRDLCSVDRSPPPSFDESPYGTVEWIVEVVLRLGSERVSVDDRLLKLPNPSALVTRIAFPLLPTDSHIQNLEDVPYFGPDPNADIFGSHVFWEGSAVSATGRLRDKEGDWRTYQKALRLNTEKAMYNEARLIAQLSVPQPAMFQRSAPSIPFPLSFRLESLPSSSKSLLSRRSTQEVVITSAMISLKSRISTRGGREIVPHSRTETIRSVVIPIGGSDGLTIRANMNEALDWEMLLDLQSESMMRGGGTICGQRNAKASTLPPSFRTPNIQQEYFVYVTITVEDHGDFYVSTFPLQVMAGNSPHLPTFDEATGDIYRRDAGQPPVYSL